MNSSSIHSINYLVQLKDDRYKHWEKKKQKKRQLNQLLGQQMELAEFARSTSGKKAS